MPRPGLFYIFIEVLDLLLSATLLEDRHSRPSPTSNSPLPHTTSDDRQILEILAAPDGPRYILRRLLMDPCWDAKCRLEFCTLEGRIRHIWSSAQHLICDVCMGRSCNFTVVPKEFESLEERLVHYYAAHFACNICSVPERIKRFGTQEDLRDHMYRHCACPMCDTPQIFDDILEMRMHIEDYHNGCIICSTKDNILLFGNEMELLSHMEDHHHACIFQCGAPKFGNNKALRQHYVDEHFGCSYCSIRSFRDEYERNDHYGNEHHDLRGEENYSHSKGYTSFRCGQCKNTAGFTQQEELAAHMRRHHGAINCPDPDCARPTYIFWQPWQRAHMETCHHPNPCNDFDTAATMGLNSCYMCNLPFWTPGTVLYHFRNYHPCTECEGYIERYFKVKTDHLSQRHGEGRSKHQPFERPHWKTSTPRSGKKRVPPPPGPVDIYGILLIHPQSSDEEAKRAARQRRIDTHPDKLQREGMSKAETDAIDEMAKLVGFAADIVSDPVKRREHDGKVRKWSIKYGRC